ncbi:uncharacterized protein LOC100892829 isoform X3 [Strongylocentrotus purpuratus]|nr:uncharacterized protein LOC100892829 isoform X3 [Strongylocentrotus purpuratus]
MESPDSTTSNTVKMEDKLLDDMKEDLMKLRDMSSWSTPEAAQLVKGISACYWNAEGHQQEVAEAFCELQGSELFINMILALNKEGLFSQNPTWQTAFYIYNTLWNLSDASLTLALRLGQGGMIKLCTTNISHKPYRDNMVQKNVLFLIKASLNILHNLAKAPGNKHVYREEKVVESMEPFLEGDPYLKAVSMMTLAYIVEEGQEEILAEKGTNTIEYLVEILKDAQNSKDKRCQGLSVEEVTAALGRLAVHDNNKYKIVEAGGLPLMISMLHDESVETQEASAHAVWNLAFSDDVSEKLRSNTDCMMALQDLSTSSSSEVAKAANGALWVINKEGEKKDLVKENEDDTGLGHSLSRKQPHIMLSYQWGCQPLVLKMRDVLAKAGYNIWVDVDCMYGSTLQAMAEAIENACAIVMCMSERYKESPNCRTEAEYAFQLRKRIIPVMMEEYYQPDGWLGIILGAKFYMDFSGRLDIEEEMNKLLKEVQMHSAEAKIIYKDDTDDGVLVGASISFPLESAGISIKMESLDWSASQVQDWLIENELEHLRPLMAEYNGKLLNQLYKMRQEAPDFFYLSIKEDFGLKKLIDILRFTEALDSLLSN